jgi:hypothetical protein
MFEYKDIKVFSLISRIWSISGRLVLYVISGAAGRTSHVLAAPPTDPARTNLLVLDLLGRSVLLRDCMTPFPAGVLLPSVAAAARPWYGVTMDCRLVTVGSPDFKLSCASDPVMIHMMSVKYGSGCHWYSALTLLVM